MQKGLELALNNRSGKQVSVSLCSYAATNGAGEYHTEFAQKDVLVLQDFHRRRLEMYSQMKDWEEVEYLAFETIPCWLEAKAILSLDTLPTTKKIWIAFSCSSMDKSTTVIRNIHRLVKEHRSTLWGVGVNCTSPQLIDHISKQLDKWEGYYVFYANGASWENGKFLDFWEAEEWAKIVGSWRYINEGRVLLGGCCMTRPEHIQGIRGI
ncbi:hypothetical protein NEOLI_003161 [Neolecta irregularis DAH-3]|uniref:Hcy-binding domain-containing protein n=1 Tax=Neolecta irregularis (strain DAH-3) TaxID=1198029 RepID=A0A1U7LPS5_NEOID|nr:hypothetical protein NEOLI_003161 [Neolecta irregularis DAH-3]|eukprot:OLL24628.1 hypothetical protein NEOLI_003161 [Neolecta irregularis DAH-3]